MSELVKTTEAEIVREVFATLSSVDVSEYTKKKNNLTYLPWADAYRLLISEYPDSEIKEYWFKGADGMDHPYYKDETGYYVVVGIKIRGIEKVEKLPVLDYRNKPIEVPKSFDINTSTKRCWVKAMALWGLGLYIYAGEDVPITPSVSRKPTDESEKQKFPNRSGKREMLQADGQPISEKQKSEIEFLLAEKGYSITECEEKLTEKFAGKLKEGPVKIDFSEMTAKKAAWLIKEIANLGGETNVQESVV